MQTLLDRPAAGVTSHGVVMNGVLTAPRRRRVWRRLVSRAAVITGGLLTLALIQTGCGTVGSEAAIGAGVVGGTVLLSQAPGQEIEQVYYLGIFDPREQLPSEVYRVTVHGQASTISGMKFGSGWLPAQLVDSLTSQASFTPGSDVASVTTTQPSDTTVHLETGRRLMLFGPEGFREAPKDHRLVIVMGSNPEAFFNAIDSSLGAIASVRGAQGNAEVVRQLAAAMQQLHAEQARLNDLQKDAAADLAEPVKSGGTNANP